MRRSWTSDLITFALSAATAIAIGVIATAVYWAVTGR
jgi:hypothetical protein